MKDYTKIIKELELQEKFDENIRDTNMSLVSSIDETYVYLPRNFFFRMYSGFIRGLVFVFAPVINNLGYKIKINGKKNLKGLKGAISVSNHVFNLDNLLIRQALRKHKLYVTGASFNNKKGLMGTTLKAGGFLPISSKLSVAKKFNNALSTVLKRGSIVHFYPEKALWVYYQKPRPLKRGAFYYAVKNEVPVVPMFLCFKRPDKFSKILGRRVLVTVNICPPIYLDKDLSQNANIDFMQAATTKEFTRVYEEFYKSKLKKEND